VTLAGGRAKRGFDPAALGALALSGSNFLRMGVQLAMLPILARLVGPAEYGLVALAVPFVLFCNMLADAGMSQALARRQDVTPELESTVFWLAGALGLALSAFACLAAWPLALVLDQPRLPWLIMALSPILVMSGLTAVSNARVIREGRFGVFAGGDFISTAASAVVALTAALNGAGAWSLVAQQLTLWVCKFAWVNLNARPQIRAYFRPSEVRDLVRFGVHSIGSNLSDFVSRNVDNMIVGGVLGTVALGYYAMAYQIVRVPDLIISGPLYLYVFTAVSRAAHDGARGKAADLAVSALRLASSVLAPTFVGLTIISPLAVALVLGDKWLEAAPVMSRLAAAGFGFAHCFVMGAILMGLGRSHLQLRMTALAGVTTVCTIAVFARFGVETAASAIGLAVLFIMLTYLEVLARDLKIRRLRLAGAFAPAALGVGAMAATLWTTAPLLAPLPPLARLGAMIGLGGVVYAAVVLAVARRRLLEDARVFARAHAKSPAGTPGSPLPEAV
jgi:PST family polysaccharide transporter